MKTLFHKLIGKIRRKKLFEANITFVVEENKSCSIFLDREVPPGYWTKHNCCPHSKNKRLLTLSRYPNGQYLPDLPAQSDLLSPGRKIGVIYWSDSYEIVKIIPMDDTKDEDNSESSSETNSAWDQIKSQINHEI